MKLASKKLKMGRKEAAKLCMESQILAGITASSLPGSDLKGTLMSLFSGRVSPVP